jgi:polysaccharide pyruvyl transferase WcaK-like protein
MEYLRQQKRVDGVSIINYFPKQYDHSFLKIMKPNYPWIMLERMKEFYKEIKISRFRKKLIMTRRYQTNQELIVAPPKCDILISGSDQVWNPNFVLHGEGKPTPTYFLNFGDSNCRRIALSVSFGCEEYPIEAERIVLPLINKFDAISVREKSGHNILQKMGIIGAKIVADPTSLLHRSQYQSICNMAIYKQPFIAKCILRKQTITAKKVILKALLFARHKKVRNILYYSIEDWLSAIRDASFVVTNSFHCIIMCLMFHSPFVAILEHGKNAGMNDRIFTLLQYFALSKQIIACEQDIECIDFQSNFDWAAIDKKMDEYSGTIKKFIDSAILSIE